MAEQTPAFDSLCLPSSLIFENAELDDNIRQSIIDFLHGDNIEDGEDIKLFNSAISELANRTLINASCPQDNLAKRSSLALLLDNLIITIMRKTKQSKEYLQSVIQKELIETNKFHDPFVALLLFFAGFTQICNDLYKDYTSTVASNQEIAPSTTKFSFFDSNVRRSLFIFLNYYILAGLLNQNQTLPDDFYKVTFNLMYSLFYQENAQSQELPKEFHLFPQLFCSEQGVSFLLGLQKADGGNLQQMINCCIEQNIDQFPLLYLPHLSQLDDAIFLSHSNKILDKLFSDTDNMKKRFIPYLIKCKEIYDRQNGTQPASFNGSSAANTILPTLSLSRMLEYLDPIDLEQNNLFDYIIHYNNLQFGPKFRQKFEEMATKPFPIFPFLDLEQIRVNRTNVRDYMDQFLEYANLFLSKPSNETTNSTITQSNQPNADNQNQPQDNNQSSQISEIQDSDFFYDDSTLGDNAKHLLQYIPPLFSEDSNETLFIDTVDFWYFVFTKVISSNPDINDLVTQIGNNSPINTEPEILINLIYDLILKDLHNTFTERKNAALYKSIQSIFSNAEEFYVLFTNSPRFLTLFNINFSYTLEFTRIFLSIESLRALSANTLVLHLMANELYYESSKSLPKDMVLIVMEQNTESEPIIKDFILNHCGSKKDLFLYKTNNDLAYNFISTAVFYASISNKSSDATFVIDCSPYTTAFMLIIYKCLNHLGYLQPDKCLLRRQFPADDFTLLFVLPDRPEEMTEFFSFIYKHYLRLLTAYRKDLFCPALRKVFLDLISGLWENGFVDYEIKKQFANGNKRCKTFSYLFDLAVFLLTITENYKENFILRIINEGIVKILPALYLNFDDFLRKAAKLQFKLSIFRNLLSSLLQNSAANFISDQMSNNFEAAFTINHIKFCNFSNNSYVNNPLPSQSYDICNNYLHQFYQENKSKDFNEVVCFLNRIVRLNANDSSNTDNSEVNTTETEEKFKLPEQFDKIVQFCLTLLREKQITCDFYLSILPIVSYISPFPFSIDDIYTLLTPFNNPSCPASIHSNFAETPLESFLSFLYDNNAIENRFRLMLEQNFLSIGQPTILVKNVFTVSHTCVLKDLDIFAKALLKTFYISPNKNLLIQRAEPIPYQPYSKDLIDFLTRILSNTTFDMDHLYFIYAISTTIPTIFLAFDFETIKNIILKGTSQLFDSSYQKQSIITILILFAILQCPRYLNDFVNYILSTMTTKTDNQSLTSAFLNSEELTLILLVLLSILNTETLQFVAVSLMIKSNWNSIASYFIEQFAQTEKSNHVIVNENLLICITTIYVNILNSITDVNAPIVDEIMASEHPFTETFNGLILAKPINLSMLMKYFVEFNQNFAPEKQVSFKAIVDELQGLINDKNASFTKSQSDQLLNKIDHTIIDIPPHKYPLPSGIDPEAFSRLPEYSQSVVLFNSLQKIGKDQINPSMRRILFHQPVWASEFVQNWSEILLLTDHYLILHQLVPQLLAVANDDSELSADEITLEQFCQPELINQIMDLASKSNPNQKNELELINAFSHNLITCQTIIDKFSEQLKSYALPHEFILYMLKLISKQDNFASIFQNSLSQSLLTYIVWLSSIQHYTQTFQLIDYYTLSHCYPKKVIQIIIFILLDHQGNKDTVMYENCISHLSKLPKSEIEDIARYISFVFHKLVAVDKPDNVPIIRLFINSFPYLIKENHQKLLEMLSHLLDRPCGNLLMIGTLFDALCPQRNHSTSMIRTQSQQEDTRSFLNIPQTIRQQDPEFWSIVEAHQSSIQELIDHQSSLLNNEFKFLKIYPEVLPLPQRMRFFTRSQSTRIGSTTTRLTVSRNNILQDSLRQILSIRPQALLNRIRIKYEDEQGIDAGGLLKDWFSTLVTQLFNPNYALFLPSSNGRSNQPNPLSYVNTECLSYFKLAGRIIARAVMEGIPVPAHFTRGFLKHILGNYNNTLKDIEDSDQNLYRSFVWILEHDVTDLDSTFVADFDDMGVHKVIELKENGDNIPVTNENKKEYIQLMINHHMVKSISKQTEAFVEGFYSVIPLADIQIFRPDELDLLICGIPEIDLEDFKRHLQFHRPYNISHKTIVLFFNVISKWKMEDLAKLLLFITGTSQVPASGFQQDPITIAYGGDKSRLPSAHTCTNTLDLPLYETEEELEQKLLLSIQECDSFGFG